MKKGFTLIEVMIVVAIIALLAAIAIPNLRRASLNANEAAVRTDLRAFSEANESYRSAQNPSAYAPTIAALTTSNPPYLDASWNTAGLAPGRHGYTFTYTAAPTGTAYSLLVTPAPKQGINSYCIDQSGVVVGSVDGASAPSGTAEGCSGGTPVTG